MNRALENQSLLRSPTLFSTALPPVEFDATVVIPVYFNEQSVARVVTEIRRAWQAHGRDAKDLQFVLVDDGSGDDSWQVLQAIQLESPETVTAVRLVQNHGSQLAVLAGFSFARGQRIAAVAADGQEPADLTARMAMAADRGARLVLATRASRQDAIGTRASAGFFYKLVRWLGLRAMPEQGFDAFLMDRELAQIILEMRDPNVPLAVTIAWLGYAYATVDYDRLERQEGKSRWTLSKKIKLALDAITSVSYTPIRAISLFGVTIALLGFLFAGFIVLQQLFFEIPVRGWASLLVVTLVIGGTQLVALGVIGEYLWRTLEVARRRPLWRIAEVAVADSPVAAPTDADSRGSTNFKQAAANQT